MLSCNFLISAVAKDDELTEIVFSTTLPLELKLITTFAVPALIGVKTNSSLELISALIAEVLLFDLIDFTIAKERLSSSETTFFKSMVATPVREVSVGNAELTIGEFTSGKTGIDWYQPFPLTVNNDC
ncbi:hypothetical protein D3C72_1746510 [compost metagenome]